jgi:hypothetical protein
MIQDGYLKTTLTPFEVEFDIPEGLEDFGKCIQSLAEVASKNSIKQTALVLALAQILHETGISPISNFMSLSKEIEARLVSLAERVDGNERSDS